MCDILPERDNPKTTKGYRERCFTPPKYTVSGKSKLQNFDHRSLHAPSVREVFFCILASVREVNLKYLTDLHFNAFSK